MKLSRNEKKTLQLEFCERCAIAHDLASVFAECERDRMFQNLLRTGFQPL